MTSTLTDKRGETGFTLVEMLVALTIFALLAAAGVGLLRSSVDTQNAVAGRLTELGGMGRLHALLSSDAAQAVDRPTRAPDGVRPAFVGTADGMTFVRGGWTNVDDAPRSELQRVRWSMDQQSLVRTAFASLDGADEPAAAAPIVRRIQSARFRYRALDGSWSDQFVSSEQAPLPAAAEVTLTPVQGPETVILVALPPLGQSDGSQTA